jgi:UDP-N-acetylmuramate--alanine ligase
MKPLMPTIRYATTLDGSIPQHRFGSTRHIHMVGIGGIGMSGMAEILLHQGYHVTGSDGASSETTDRLTSLGATVYIGHDAAHIEGADVVVYTSAVQADENVETKAALEASVPVIKRAEMLAEMMRMKVGIGIAGTHGKTTTTTMLGHIIQDAELDPTIIVGGRVHSFDKTNAVVGKGEFLIVEADEYDRTFLKLTPTMAIITNVEAEHLDIYKDIEDVKQAFVEFANKVPFYGVVAVCIDDPTLRSLIPDLTRRLITYGLDPSADVYGFNVVKNAFSTSFEVIAKGRSLGEFTLRVPGDYNVSNALGAISLALDLGVPADTIKRGLERFDGVFRRFQKKMDHRGVLLIDDYAHHPTEVAATLQGAKHGWPDRRRIAVFQPHLYSRTQQMATEFGASFGDADHVIITDVYPAREKPIDGVTGALVAKAAKEAGHPSVQYIGSVEDLPSHLIDLATDGDLILTMGAGTIYRYGEEFARLWQGGSA